MGSILILTSIAVYIIIFFVVRSLLKEHKLEKKIMDKTAKKWNLIIILSVIIVFFSWLFNIGIFRLFLTLIPISLVHTIAFLFINSKAVGNISHFKELKKYVVLSISTYLLSYLLLPDFLDIGGGYLFFGLIRDETIISVMLYMSVILFILNVAILIYEYLQLSKYKSK